MVVNAKGATVGSLLGDGLALTFSEPADVGVFRVCLLITEATDTKAFSMADFGFSTLPYQYIYPLSMWKEGFLRI